MWWVFLSNGFMRLYDRSRRARLAPAGRSTFDTVEVVERVWAEIAGARGLAATEPSDEHLILFTGTVDGLACELALVAVDGAIVPRTRVRASPARGGALRVVPATAGARMIAMVSGKRIRAVEPMFDARFVAMGEGSLLDEPMRQTMLSFLPREPALVVDSGRVELVLEGAELVHENVAAALDLVTRVARGVPAEGGARPYRAVPS